MNQNNPQLIEIIHRLHNKLNIINDDELILINRFKDKSINIQYANRRLKEIAKKYNLKISVNSMSTHTFRKTLGRRVWAMNQYSEKSLIMLGDLFNHFSIGITKVYLGIKSQEIGD
ncbi:hypothetical protein LCGC14_2631130, partial [marine sediment metagenome]